MDVFEKAPDEVHIRTVPNPLIASSTLQLKTTKRGTLVVDEHGRTTMEASEPGETSPAAKPP